VELGDRRTADVVRVCYYHLNFDEKGILDYERWLKEGMVPLLASPDSWPRRDPSDKLISAEHRFAARRLNEVVRWKPTAKVERAIYEASLDDPRYRRI
jgi:hypothetical protein